MQNLHGMLANSDPNLLPAFAQVWGVNTKNLDNMEIIAALVTAMHDAKRVEKLWDSLLPAERGALQSLAGMKNKMPATMFERMHGKIRKLGRAQIDREQPHLQHVTSAEALFYRGLIAEGSEQAKDGLRLVIYIPDDLLLPLHKNAYTQMKADIQETMPMDTTTAIKREIRPLDPLPEDELEGVIAADTSMVDDMTTLLAFLRIHGAAVEGDSFLPIDRDKILPFLLHKDTERLIFLLGVGVSANLIEVRDGRAYVGKERAPTWLGEPRAQQIRQLAEAWRKSLHYFDLWHVEGLFPEGSWTYDPLLGREVALQTIKQYTRQGWWAIDEWIDLQKALSPDFQRQEYDSWYIRNDEGEFLRGFASWDAVEGALLEFYVRCPLHWLGMVDISEEAARLTAYGRAFLGLGEWHNPNIKPELIQVNPDGTLIASRKVPCVDRFQLARFTSWVTTDEVYSYRLDKAGLQQAAAQGISPAHVNAFLRRQLENKPIPPKMMSVLETWQALPTSTPDLLHVSFERVMIIRTTAKDTLDHMYDNPTLRRYLRARLGETAGVIDGEQAEAFKKALEEAGMKVEIHG